MTGLLSAVLAFLFLGSSGAVLAVATQASASARNLEPVAFPDGNRLDPSVQRQLREAQSSWQATLGKPGVTDQELSEAYGSLGKLYHAYRLEAAGACYRNAQALAPRDFRWPYYLGRLYQSESKLPESAASYEAALAIRPADPSAEMVMAPYISAAQLGLAEVLLGQNHPELAEQLFAKVLAAESNSAVALAGLGNCAAARSDFRKAVEYLEAALKIQPEASGLHYPLAMAYRQLGDRERALDHLDQRGAKLPHSPDPLMDELRELATGKRNFYLRGFRAYREGDFVKAAEEYQKMVAADPGDPIARLELGAVLVRLGNAKAALEQFSEALRLAPGNVTALYNLGILYTQAGSSQEAIRYYEAALHIDPELQQAHFQLANELMRTSQFDKAVSHYETVVKLDPRNGFARLMSGIALVRLRRYAEARAVLEDSLMAFPGDPDTSTALARLLAACPDGAIRDGRRALELLQRVFQIQRSVEIEQTEALAMALAETGRFKEAIEVQQTMISQAKRAGSSELARVFGETLALYQRGKPCRQPWRDDDPIFTPVPGKIAPMSSGLGPVAGMSQERDR